MADERNKSIADDSGDTSNGRNNGRLNPSSPELGNVVIDDFELSCLQANWGQSSQAFWDGYVEFSQSAPTQVPPLDRVLWQGHVPARNLSAMMSADYDDGEHASMDVETLDREQDSQSKRPKVLGAGNESQQHISSPYFTFEASSLATQESETRKTLLPLERELVPSARGCPTITVDAPEEAAKVIESMDADNAESETSNDSLIRMDFSEDLLHLIFSFLDQKDLCRAGATCKLWLSASTHEDFWRSLNLENIGISHANFLAICRRYGSITELNLFGVPSADTLVTDAIRYLRKLKSLTMGKGHLSDIFFQALNDCLDLTTLVVCDGSLGNTIQEITISHDALRELQILRCRAIRISVRCPQLKKLSLRRTTMTYVSLNCLQLEGLDFSSCHKLSDAAIRQACTTCPMLASLDLSSCACATDETLRDIASSCPCLSVLDASNCPNIAFESVRLPMLTGLKLLSCDGITSASMASISFSRVLETLHLDNCSLLTSIALDLPLLKNISLVHLRKFVDLKLRCPVLSYIKISRCSALKTILIASKALQKLELRKQESLASVSLQCPNVVDVDLSDCESLTNAICQVFSDGGGCPMLMSLALDNCDSLNKVELNSSSLSSLSLSGCRAMTCLQLSCPKLQNVILDGCDHLERASFCPVGIESLNLGICPKLTVLQIEAPRMLLLELKGCGILSEASIYCPSLTSLDASFCRQLLDASLSLAASSCPLIEYLTLSSCICIGTDGLSSLNFLRRLTLLDLSYTFLTNLQPVFDTCLQLKVLKLSACKFLTDASLYALYREGALPTLTELDLSYSSIGQMAISELLICCTNLKYVNLNGCTNLHELMLCPSDENSGGNAMDICPSELTTMKYEEACKTTKHLLEVLNCIGCPNLKKIFIPPMAICVHLIKLNLNLSTSLKEVDLTCPSLCSLNLGNCSSLEVLKLSCPRLGNIQLVACAMLQEDELVSAISRCKMLESLNVTSCPKLSMLDFGALRTICPSLKRIHSGVQL